MLISFAVTNFKSFGDEATLEMVASTKLTDHPTHLVPIPDSTEKVLRTAVIYGANAAGKSNLVSAIAFAQRLICLRTERITPTEPFRFRPNAGEEPSSFEFRFLTDNKVFVYGFDMQGTRFCGEWLGFLKENETLTIYQRDRQGNAVLESKRLNSYFPDDPLLVNTLEAITKLRVRDDQLVLNRINGLPEDIQGQTLRCVLKWFKDDLLVLSADYRSPRTLSRLFSDSAYRDFCSRFLNQVSTGVDSLELHTTERTATDEERRWIEFSKKNEVPLEALPPFFQSDDHAQDLKTNPEDSGRIISRELLSVHTANNHAYKLPFGQESDGTKKLAHLMPVLSNRDSGRVVIIDELDRSLHPIICWEFVRYFSESSPGVRKQLIVTTHEAHLLNQDLLRRDEYWFVEKDAQQQSRMVSLSEFKIRNDLVIEKGYLNGRFGAIPMIGNMQDLENLLNNGQSEDTKCH